MSNYMKAFSLTVDAVATAENTNASTVVFTQGDLNNAQLSLTLTFNGAPMDLTTATAIEVYYQASDNSITQQDMTNGIIITNATEGQINISMNSQSLAIPGKVTTEVHVIYPGNQIIIFKRFTFTVKSSLSGGAVSQNSFQIWIPLQVVNSISLLPTASAATQFGIYAVKGTSGTAADGIYICKMLSNGTYDWVQMA